MVELVVGWGRGRVAVLTGGRGGMGEVGGSCFFLPVGSLWLLVQPFQSGSVQSSDVAMHF